MASAIVSMLLGAALSLHSPSALSTSTTHLSTSDAPRPPYVRLRGGETVLVTGGAGYIGSHTVLELLEHGVRADVSGAAGDVYWLASAQPYVGRSRRVRGGEMRR